MGKIRTFEDLEVWQLARELRKKIYDLSAGFPNEERYNLRLQLRKSAISITANIAEGFGRFHYQENIQFCRQARGSLLEVIDHLIAAYDADYTSEEALDQLKAFAYRILKVLNAYIASIQRIQRLDDH